MTSGDPSAIQICRNLAKGFSSTAHADHSEADPIPDAQAVSASPRNQTFVHGGTHDSLAPQLKSFTTKPFYPESCRAYE